jgi:hypothetical protein
MTISRRSFIGASAAGVLAAGLPAVRTWGDSAIDVPIGERYITSYYQFTREAFRTLAANTLPNGPEYLHIFVQSAADIRPHRDAVNLVHSGGESFKYGCAFDLHRYKWQDASDDQLKAWAIEFRTAGLDASATCDYFAFNEMPDEAPAHPEIRQKVARLTRYLHSAGGGPTWRGVFYFTQKNLTPATWVGRSDELWEVIDETCDLVVGERFEKLSFATRHSLPELANFFDVMPKFLAASGDPHQIRIARDKYAILHSTYYGTKSTNWAGLRSDQSSPAELKGYLEKLVTATRMSEFGKRRIVFSPLDTMNLDSRMFGVLAEVIREDRCGKRN